MQTLNPTGLGVHFKGFNKKYDEVIPYKQEERVAPLGYYTKRRGKSLVRRVIEVHQDHIDLNESEASQDTCTRESFTRVSAQAIPFSPPIDSDNEDAYVEVSDDETNFDNPSSVVMLDSNWQALQDILTPKEFLVLRAVAGLCQP